MAETIFRYIDGVLRPIKVSNINAGKQSVMTVNQHSQIPKHKLVPGHYRTSHAFTIPNATCQICGAKVFYYEHPNGARVLFDQLGPPWPKHPCYEAGQAIKPNVIVQTTAAPALGWERDGWQPLFHEKHILLQSGSTIRIQAYTESYLLIFEIQVAELHRRHIQSEQLDKLLMQAKKEHGKALIQIHDGSRPFEIMTTNIRLIEPAVSMISVEQRLPKEQNKECTTRLSDRKLASLIWFDVAIRCFHDKKKWHVNLTHLEQTHTLSFNEKNFKHLKSFIGSLEAWISKPNKNNNRTVFLLEASNRQHVTAVISSDVFSSLTTVVEKPNSPTLKNNLGVKAERLEVVSITPDLPTTKLVCGTLGEKSIKIRVDNKLFRLGETEKQIIAGVVQIFLRQGKDAEANKADFAIYIQKGGGIISSRPRGYVSQLTRKILALPVTLSNQDGVDRSGHRTVRHKAFAVTLNSVDFSQDEKICLKVTDKQREYQLRLHSVSKKVRGQIVELAKNHHRHATHLVRRSDHSYQFHLDGQFIVMASEEAFFEQRTRRSSDDISDMQVRATRTVDSAGVSISERIQKNAHLEQHGLGAALLEAVKSMKKSSV